MNNTKLKRKRATARGDFKKEGMVKTEHRQATARVEVR
jgi:hypothetical protein